MSPPSPADLIQARYGIDAFNPDSLWNSDTMQQFYESQQMSVAGDWVEHSLKRVGSAAALNGRDKLKEILQRLGFPLR